MKIYFFLNSVILLLPIYTVLYSIMFILIPYGKDIEATIGTCERKQKKIHSTVESGETMYSS